MRDHDSERSYIIEWGQMLHQTRATSPLAALASARLPKTAKNVHVYVWHGGDSTQGGRLVHLKGVL